MKKTIALLVLLIGLNTTAQKMYPSMQRKMLPKFTPEQQATLKSKKMTLQLDLNNKQQNQIYSLILKHEQNIQKFKQKQRAAFIKGEKPSREQQFNLLNKGLEARINFQKKLKNILTDKQYQQWKREAAKKTQRHKNIRKLKNGYKRLERKF